MTKRSPLRIHTTKKLIALMRIKKRSPAQIHETKKLIALMREQWGFDHG